MATATRGSHCLYCDAVAVCGLVARRRVQPVRTARPGSAIAGERQFLSLRPIRTWSSRICRTQSPRRIPSITSVASPIHRGRRARSCSFRRPMPAPATPASLPTWTVDQERTYFQNLVARASGKVNAYSNLLLTNTLGNRHRRFVDAGVRLHADVRAHRSSFSDGAMREPAVRPRVGQQQRMGDLPLE